MSQELNTGVYGIYYKDKLIYVGSTITSFDHRWKMHNRELNKNYHHCSRMQNVFNKYGNGFVFKILEIAYPENCIKLEQIYLDSYLHEGLWNTSPTAASVQGIKHTKEQKIARSKQVTERMKNPIERQKSKDGNIKAWLCPKLRARHSIIVRQTQSDPNIRKKMSDMCLLRDANKRTINKLEYVHKRKNNGSYISQVKRQGKRIFYKTFKTELEAFLGAYSAIAIYNKEYCEVIK